MQASKTLETRRQKAKLKNRLLRLSQSLSMLERLLSWRVWKTFNLGFAQQLILIC